VLSVGIFKNFYKIDHITLKRWISEFSFLYNKSFKINKNKQKKIKVLKSDNIRVALKYKKNFFFSLSHIFKNFYNYKQIEKLLLVKQIKSSADYFNSFKLKKEFFDIDIKFIKKKKLNIKKVLILGPHKRNKKIIKVLKKNFKVLLINQRIDLKYLKNKKIDYLVSSGYAYKISNKIVKIFKGRIINLHATFLPWGKGIGTTFFSVVFREPMGISIHEIDENFDTGPIIYRKKINFINKDTTRTFYNKLLKSLEKYSCENLNKIIQNEYKKNYQKNFRVKTNYFSRDQFEKIIEILPNGYDTKMIDLIKLSNLIINNNKFLNIK